MKYTKKDFKEATKLRNIWNKTITWHEFTLATVLWDRNPWKIVDNGTTFDQLTNSIDIPAPKDAIFQIPTSKRTYTPIAEFHTQEELWRYINK